MTARVEAPLDARLTHVKAWKVLPGVRVDLATSGGHDVQFPGRVVAPERLILKHYPLRGPAQAARKLADYARRWDPAERARGWHAQYGPVPETAG